MATKLSIVDLFNNLSDGDKRRALKVLQQAEQTPCQRLGHNLKHAGTKVEWFKSVENLFICTRCGHKEIV